MHFGDAYSYKIYFSYSSNFMVFENIADVKSKVGNFSKRTETNFWKVSKISDHVRGGSKDFEVKIWNYKIEIWIS